MSHERPVDALNVQSETELSQPEESIQSAILPSSFVEKSPLRKNEKSAKRQSSSSSNRKRKKKEDEDEDDLDRAIFDKIVNAKKINPLAQMVDDMIVKLNEKGLNKESLEFRRSISTVIDMFEEKLL